MDENVKINKSSLIEYLSSLTEKFKTWEEAEKEVSRIFPNKIEYSTEDLEYLIEGD